jgi:hypothetical protein
MDTADVSTVGIGTNDISAELFSSNANADATDAVRMGTSGDVFTADDESCDDAANVCRDDSHSGVLW